MNAVVLLHLITSTEDSTNPKMPYYVCSGRPNKSFITCLVILTMFTKKEEK